MTWLLVAIGGASGALTRYCLSNLMAPYWSLVVINGLGSFLMGIAFVAISKSTLLPALLMTGFLGGFTTFSAFSLDVLKLWEAGRFTAAALYVGGSLIISLAGVFGGAALARSLT